MTHSTLRFGDPRLLRDGPVLDFKELGNSGGWIFLTTAYIIIIAAFAVALKAGAYRA